MNGRVLVVGVVGWLILVVCYVAVVVGMVVMVMALVMMHVAAVVAVAARGQCVTVPRDLLSSPLFPNPLLQEAAAIVVPCAMCREWDVYGMWWPTGEMVEMPWTSTHGASGLCPMYTPQLGNIGFEDTSIANQCLFRWCLACKNYPTVRSLQPV